MKKPSNCKQIIDADIIATRVIIYHHLDFSTQEEVNKVFRINKDSGFEQRYQILTGLSEEQTAYLIRKALQGKSDSKYPQNLLGHCLYHHAESWEVKKTGDRGKTSQDHKG